jgi:hypothetical protein
MRAVHEYAPAKVLFEHHIAAARATLEALIGDAIAHGWFRPVDAPTMVEAILALVLHFTDGDRADSAALLPAAALATVFDVLITGGASG